MYCLSFTFVVVQFPFITRCVINSLFLLFQVPREGAAIMASDEQFSLCWNNFHANMSAGFHGLLSRGDLVDVTLAAEGRLLQAHKLVLSVCSPYFQEMFKMNPTQHPIGMYLIYEF